MNYANYDLTMEEPVERFKDMSPMSQLVREMREDIYDWILECSKTATGAKQRLDISRFSTVELERIADSWQLSADSQMDHERKMQADCRKQFEERIAEHIEMGAGDRATALRWMIQADDLEQDDDSYCQYTWGVGYDYDLANGGVIEKLSYMKI